MWRLLAVSYVILMLKLDDAVLRLHNFICKRGATFLLEPWHSLQRGKHTTVLHKLFHTYRLWCVQLESRIQDIVMKISWVNKHLSQSEPCIRCLVSTKMLERNCMWLCKDHWQCTEISMNHLQTICNCKEYKSLALSVEASKKHP